MWCLHPPLESEDYAVLFSIFLDLFLGLLFLLSAMVHDHAIIIWEKINKLFPMEEANLRLSLPKVIKGSFHMARSDAHPLFQVVEISLRITNTSSLKVSSSDWKTKSSTNICGLVASQNGKGPTFHKFPRKDFRKTSQTLGRSNPKNHPEPTPSWRLIARMAWKTFAWFGGPEL